MKIETEYKLELSEGEFLWAQKVLKTSGYLKRESEFIERKGRSVLKIKHTDYRGEFLRCSGMLSLDEAIFLNKTKYFIKLEVFVPPEESQKIRPRLRYYLLDTFSFSDFIEENKIN